MSLGSGLTPRAVAVGAALGAILAGANLYVAMKTTNANAGHIPAVLAGYAILAALARGNPPRTAETAVVQTVASSAAMMSIAGGFVGPVTALILTGREPPLPAIAAWSVLVGSTGCVLAIPLRTAFVVRGALAFPVAVATAQVIATVHDGTRAAGARIRTLGLGAAAAAAIAVARQLLHWIPERTILPITVGDVSARGVLFGIAWSPLLLGAGWFAGIRTGLAMLAGAVIAWLIIAPALVDAGVVTEPRYGPLLGWLLWPGVALMIGGVLSGVVAGWRHLRGGVDQLRHGGVAGGGELPWSRVHTAAALAGAAALVAVSRIVFEVDPVITVLALALSAVLCIAAARAKGETDNTPAGQLGALGQLAVGAVASGGVSAPLSGGGLVSGTAMESATLLVNWRIGRAAGAAPGAQLIASLVGVIVGAIATTAAFELIRRGYGLATDAMPVPGALSWKATAEVVQHGVSAMPPHVPLAALVALVVGVVLPLAARHRRLGFLPSPIALGVAFMIPPYISITIAAGAIVLWLVRRARPAWSDAHGTSLASGAMAGEAIVGLIVAGLVVGGVVER